MSNLVNMFKETVKNYSDHLAIVFGEHRITYDKLNEAINRLAHGLSEIGIKPGHRVALILPNIPQFPISYYALLKMGAVVIPVNVLYKDSELRYILEDSKAQAIISWEGLGHTVTTAIQDSPSCPHLIMQGTKIPSNALNLTQLIAQSRSDEYSVELNEEDTAVISYTSGITDLPKGVELTHRNMSSNMLACREILRPTSSDVFIGVLPLFHPIAQTVIMNMTFAAASQLVLQPKFEPEEVLKSIAENKASILVGVPGMYQAFSELENKNYDLSSLKYCVSAASPMPAEVLSRFEEQFGVTILEGYGLTEATSLVCMNRSNVERKPGSGGLPLSGVDVKIFDDQDQELPPGQIGEIVVRGANVMKGYVDRPDATKEALRNGWLHTNDMGKMDEDGFFYIISRKQDVITKGGFNIYPHEVEAFLHEHPKIKEAVIIGVSDPIQGQEVKACVVLQNDKKATADEIIAYCREKMAVYKCPKYVQFYKSLPKSHTGRILKRKLREEIKN